MSCRRSCGLVCACVCMWLGGGGGGGGGPNRCRAGSTFARASRVHIGARVAGGDLRPLYSAKNISVHHSSSICRRKLPDLPAPPRTRVPARGRAQTRLVRSQRQRGLRQIMGATLFVSKRGGGERVRDGRSELNLLSLSLFLSFFRSVGSALLKGGGSPFWPSPRVPVGAARTTPWEGAAGNNGGAVGGRARRTTLSCRASRA